MAAPSEGRRGKGRLPNACHCNLTSPTARPRPLSFLENEKLAEQRDLHLEAALCCYAFSSPFEIEPDGAEAVESSMRFMGRIRRLQAC